MIINLLAACWTGLKRILSDGNFYAGIAHFYAEMTQKLPPITNNAGFYAPNADGLRFVKIISLTFLDLLPNEDFVQLA